MATNILGQPSRGILRGGVGETFNRNNNCPRPLGRGTGPAGKTTPAYVGGIMQEHFIRISIKEFNEDNHHHDELVFRYLETLMNGYCSGSIVGTYANIKWLKAYVATHCSQDMWSKVWKVISSKFWLRPDRFDAILTFAKTQGWKSPVYNYDGNFFTYKDIEWYLARPQLELEFWDRVQEDAIEYIEDHLNLVILSDKPIENLSVAMEIYDYKWGCQSSRAWMSFSPRWQWKNQP